MRKRTESADISNKRLLSINEVSLYLGLGNSKTRVYMDEIGATRKIGARVLFDKKIIDGALDKMQA